MRIVGSIAAEEGEFSQRTPDRRVELRAVIFVNRVPVDLCRVIQSHFAQVRFEFGGFEAVTELQRFLWPPLASTLMRREPPF